jgi:hypothetical protein
MLTTNSKSRSIRKHEAITIFVTADFSKRKQNNVIKNAIPYL